MSGRYLQWLSALLLIAGLSMLVVFGHHLYTNASGRNAGLEAFEAAKEARQVENSVAPGSTVTHSTMPAPGIEIDRLPPFERADGRLRSTAPETSGWSESRRQSYDGLAIDDGQLPEGILRIPAVSLEVPIFADTGEYALTRGAGRIEGTSAPGEPGNTGIAAHRDGWFRALKDVRVGDTVEIETLRGEDRFRITETFVVDPTDIRVLAPTATQSLTLVTCYPFYFVGSAPQRYIVRAVRT